MSSLTASSGTSSLPRLVPRKHRPPPSNPVPVPSTPSLAAPPDLSTLSPGLPHRRILSFNDLKSFNESETFALILAFVFSVSESCTDLKISEVPAAATLPVVLALSSILEKIDALVDSHPPAEQGESRFGNPAFRDFYDDLKSHQDSLHTSLDLPGSGWTREVSTYLQESFGSRERLDYGSGHELNFMLWLLTLNRLSLLPPQTFSAVGLSIFPAYIRLMRKIQMTYYLEPAGSHGVWGLDDYHFLPFLFGASQLLHHPYIRPLSIHNEVVLEEAGRDYIYLDMIRWTSSTKTVKGLKWTQPMLDDISGAKGWDKIEQGMRRMFVKEILGKLPIMQHFLFGSLIKADVRMSLRDTGQHPIDHTMPGHSHDANSESGWGDCCGIKIPSVAVAARVDQQHESKDELRRIPFD